MAKTENQTIVIKDLTFTYPAKSIPALNNLDLTINQGEFVVICGLSGCGKTTLLRQLKPSLIPHGISTGEVFFEGHLLSSISKRDASSKIGFVLQNPENQTVTDKVWHELAFGMESLGFDNATIRLRVAEMASFFGIQTWFHKDVDELSGGQKQLLALASVMALQPSLIILDEPTSQLDPIAAAEFLATVGKINRELGVTVVLTEHRLEEVFPLANRVVAMDGGEIISDGEPTFVGETLRSMKHAMFAAMPVPMRTWASVESDYKCPITVRDGRQWLSDIKEQIKPIAEEKSENIGRKETPAIEIEEAWFRYAKELPDIVKGLSFKAYHGEVTTILGGNGTGKTTTLSLIAGLNKPYRGKVKIEGANVASISTAKLFDKWLAYLPQNPQSLFVEKTVSEDLLEIIDKDKMSQVEKRSELAKIAKLCDLEKLLNSHPYDLSGGEQQRAALAKVLLLKPRILILDEPTKGLDAQFKAIFASILNKLKAAGVAIIIVSHDIEFCAEYADECVLFFDGKIVTQNPPRQFFGGNSFYTSAANRMARHLLPTAIIAEDIVKALGKEPIVFESVDTSDDGDIYSLKKSANNNKSEKREDEPTRKEAVSKLSRQTLMTMTMIFVIIPLTIYMGTQFLGERRYYIVSLLVIMETLVPFAMAFEKHKPKARELVIIAVLCALGWLGRVAFFMIPQFKPAIAIIIIAGVSLGGEVGFLVGAATGLIGNMFFGQGPWTPWQMFSFGIIGFIAGVIFRKEELRQNKIILCAFGGFATFAIYGVIMNSASVLIYQNSPTLPMFIIMWIKGLPFDIIHAVSTIIFLSLIAKPILEKLDRIKLKYGLINRV